LVRREVIALRLWSTRLSLYSTLVLSPYDVGL